MHFLAGAALNCLDNSLSCLCWRLPDANNLPGVNAVGVPDAGIERQQAVDGSAVVGRNFPKRVARLHGVVGKRDRDVAEKLREKSGR